MTSFPAHHSAKCAQWELCVEDSFRRTSRKTCGMWFVNEGTLFQFYDNNNKKAQDACLPL